MPEILTPAIAPVNSEIPVAGRPLHALLNLLSDTNPPVDKRELSRVTSVSATALNTFLRSISGHNQSLWDYASDIEFVDSLLSKNPTPKQPMAMAGLKVSNPIWHFLVTTSGTADHSLLTAIGAELAISAILRRQFRNKTCRDLIKARASSTAKEDTKRLASRLTSEAEVLIVQWTNQSSHDLNLFTSILASLSSQFGQHKVRQRQGVATTHELSDFEILEAADLLKRNVQLGCIVSLQIVICYCLGLPWEIGLDVPFSHALTGDWVALIEGNTGWTKLDLSLCLPRMAKGTAAHVAAEPVLVRPLPKFAAEQLHMALSKTPSASRPRDFGSNSLRNTDLIPGADPVRQSRLTIAKFIASRGNTAIAAGLDRATATYESGDFTKIGKSKNYYLTFSPEEIWEACKKKFEWMDWGPPVSMLRDQLLFIGSRATPLIETVLAIDACLLKNIQDNKAGRNYRLESLVAHTNSFSIFCANRLAFLQSARVARGYKFLASDFSPNAVFGRLGDKTYKGRTGLTPLPMPVSVAEQVRLWLAHLKILDERLIKLGIPETHQLRIRIKAVLSGEKVPLFFQLLRETVVEVGSKHVRKSLPKILRIKFDYGRHFMENEMRRRGIPSIFVDASSRRQIEGTSVTNATSAVAQIHWLTKVADAIDQIALSLNMTPVVGLGKGN